ncbi:predicted protein [Naegleria gruberi]|uniref:Predicted protein n=1 Tax=Naegleria gruberi TaxID=5762 RepID=D2VF34_NAEGR|nr:uncharacterized protein NAEGRDRAFT_79707 [Naegleria gruberi]EFC44613.1 predicted protein [Naegleria gruberi]|eukprot:XP_002677357.1 predicted protein [Naegleria gruberi strain NEG-M]
MLSKADADQRILDFPSSIFSQGTIWVCGRNVDGQLLTPCKDTTFHSVSDILPVEVSEIFPYGDSLKWIGAGDHFTILVTKSNVVYAAGQNTSGQLGLDHNKVLTEKVVRVHFFDHKNIASISCGAYYTFFMEEIGDSQIVYVCGKNNSGQLGITYNEDEDNLIFPPHNLNLSFIENDRIEKIVCGYETTLILCKSGKLYGAGANTTNQLARPSSDPLLHKSGSFELCNFESLISDHEKIIDVSLGTSYVLILTDIGNVYSNVNTSYPFFKRIGLNSSPFSKIHFGASNAYLKISDNHPNEDIAGKITQLLIDNQSGSFDNNLNILDPVINNSDTNIAIMSGLTGFFFISADYSQVFSLGSSGSGELGYIVHSVPVPERNFIVETIISRTRSSSNRELEPKIVCGYSHTLLYFSDVRSRNYLLFVANMEKHSHTTTYLCDISFVF